MPRMKDYRMCSLHGGVVEVVAQLSSEGGPDVLVVRIVGHPMLSTTLARHLSPPTDGDVVAKVPWMMIGLREALSGYFDLLDSACPADAVEQRHDFPLTIAVSPGYEGEVRGLLRKLCDEGRALGLLDACYTVPDE
jgi:hypothetical protein